MNFVSNLSNRHLGIMGGSNGGLLVGMAMTQRPDFYNAVVCSAPLLDMKRYNKILQGQARWENSGIRTFPKSGPIFKNIRRCSMSLIPNNIHRHCLQQPRETAAYILDMRGKWPLKWKTRDMRSFILGIYHRFQINCLNLTGESEWINR